MKLSFLDELSAIWLEEAIFDYLLVPDKLTE
jgi:hypothetical protein